MPVGYWYRPSQLPLQLPIIRTAGIFRTATTALLLPLQVQQPILLASNSRQRRSFTYGRTYPHNYSHTFNHRDSVHLAHPTAGVPASEPHAPAPSYLRHRDLPINRRTEEDGIETNARQSRTFKLFIRRIPLRENRAWSKRNHRTLPY